MRAEKGAPRDLADALAELKAIKIAQAAPGALVLGSDSLVALDDGTMLDKPESREQATAHLRAMSGRRHDLVSAAVIAENGRPVWRVVDRAKRSEEHTSELQSLMRISYAVFCLKKKNKSTKSISQANELTLRSIYTSKYKSHKLYSTLYDK